MEKYRLLYYRSLCYQENNLNFLQEQFDVVELQDPSFDSREVLNDIHVLLAPLGYRVDRSKIDTCLNLKIIGSNTTGHPHIDVEYARSKGIRVVTLKNEHEFLRNITPTAEHTWGLLLALTRHLIPAHQSVQQGQWNRRPFGGRQMLSRMKLGIVGLGRLGYKVSQYALKFGMHVGYFDPYVASGYPGLIKFQRLEEMVMQSDAVTIHVPHEKETEGLFSEEIFKQFKKGSYLINTSRGELIDHSALLRSLEDGTLAGAALDVFENEFDPDFETNLSSHPLWKYSKDNHNLILTPHIGGSTYDAWYETERFMIERVLDLLKSPQLSHESRPVKKGETWAFIPARGGSKSIPLKNMVVLNGKPLIDYAIAAGRSTPLISRIICSTDNEVIINHCNELGIEIQKRPDHLSTDNISTLDVILHFLRTIQENEGELPEYLVLLEPTSPFVSKDHIEKCIDILGEDHDADSAQTVTRVSSNSHAYNQRYHDDNGSNFLHLDERKICINKQLKPELFIHGNVRVMRVRSLLKTKNIFGNKSIPVEIPRLPAMDVDGPDDLIMAEMIIKNCLIQKENGK